MKIALDIRMYRHSGIGTVLRGLLRGFSEILPADDFSLVCPKDVYDSFAGNIKKKHIDFNASIYGLKGMLFYPDLEDADLLHYPHYNFPLRCHTRTIINFHDLAHLHYPTKFIHKAYINYYLSAVRKRGIRIITGTQFIKRELMETGNIRQDNISVVPHAIDLDFFKRASDEDVAKFKRRRALPNEYILALGIVKPHKNIELLLRTLKTGLLDGINLVFSSADNKGIEELALRAKEIGVSGRIILLSDIKLEEVPLLYSGASVFVFPSLYEGFGLPPIEAMACGTPVASSKAEPMPETLGDAAEYFDPSDEESCAAAILKLLSDSEKRRNLIAKGYAAAKKNSWSDIARMMLCEYKNALD